MIYRVSPTEVLVFGDGYARVHCYHNSIMFRTYLLLQKDTVNAILKEKMTSDMRYNCRKYLEAITCEEL